MKGKLLKRIAAMAAACAAAMGTVTTMPKIKGDWIFGTEVSAKTVMASAEDYKYFVHDDNTVSIWEYTGAGGDIEIPSEIDGKRVTEICYRAFSDCDSLTGVTIPYGVTSIGGHAFWHCGKLTGIVIPSSVTSIGYIAFIECPNLTVYGYNNSYAQQYSNEEGIPFKYACEFYSPAVHDIEAASNVKESSAYWTCKACGKYFSDKKGRNEITLEALTASDEGSSVTEDNAKSAAKKNVTTVFEYPGYTLSVNSDDMNSGKAGNLGFSSKTKFLTKRENNAFAEAAEVRQFAFKSASFNGINKATLTVTMTGGSKGKTAKLLLRTAEGKYILIAEETVGSKDRQVFFDITRPGNYIVYTGEADIEYETAE